MESIKHQPQIFYPWVDPKGIMNLQPLSTNWIDIDKNYLSNLHIKTSLLELEESKVFRSTSNSQRASMEVLQHVLDSLPLGVASYNGNTVSVRINKTAENPFYEAKCLFSRGHFTTLECCYTSARPKIFDR